MNPAVASIGINAYSMTNVGHRKIDSSFNRSSSTHSGKFQTRLEPLVQRHQKISRIAVRNHNDASYESKKELH